jgi:hypothetical protein
MRVFYLIQTVLSQGTVINEVIHQGRRDIRFKLPMDYW